MWRVLLKSNWSYDAFLVVAVFATSPFVVMSGHLVGYHDQLIIPFALISAWLLLHDRRWSAVCLAAIAVLIHESFIVVGFPLVILAGYLRTQTTTSERNYLKPFLHSLRPLLPLLLVIVTFLLLIVSGALMTNPAHLSTMLARRLHMFDFLANRMDVLVPRYLTTSLFAFLRSQSPHLLARLTGYGTRIVIPSTITLVSFLAWRGRTQIGWPTIPLVAGVTLLPLLLHAVAWDTGRISVYLILTSFGCVWLYSEIAPPARQISLWVLRLWRVVALPTLIFNLFIRGRLMDNQVERFANTTRLLLYAPLIVGTLILIFLELQRERRYQIDTKNKAIQALA
jgi:hypothetical protein